MAYTADKLIEIALNEVGYVEKKSNSNLDSKTGNAGKNNWTKYARDLNKAGYYNGNKNGYAWCDVFVDWCFYQLCGKDAKKAEAMICQTGDYGAGCVYSSRYYRNAGRFYSSPKVGDQIFFGSKGKENHTGIVYKVDASKVYTIEGNTSGDAGVVANGGGVFKKSYSLKYYKIVGYGRPKYDVVEQPASTNTNTNASVNTSTSTNVSANATTNSTVAIVGKIDTIKEVQQWANTNYKAGLEVDGSYGPKTKKALVKILQTELNQTYKTKLEVDGSYGPKTRAATPSLNKGDKNDVVGVLQALLICNGYNGAYLDKSYGAATVSAVKSYQKKNGLKVDGSAGKNTFAKLCG